MKKLRERNKVFTIVIYIYRVSPVRIKKTNKKAINNRKHKKIIHKKNKIFIYNKKIYNII